MSLLALFALPYILEAELVGMALAAARARFGAPASKWATIATLILAFAILDTYLLGVVASLRLRVWIGNAQIAEALEMTEPFWAHDLISIEWIDVFVWGAQTLVAAWMAAQFDADSHDAARPVDPSWAPESVPSGFVKTPDGVAYYPMPLLANGRLVPDALTLDRIRRSIGRGILMLGISSAAVLALGVRFGDVAFFAATPVLLLYWLAESARHRGTYVALAVAPGRFPFAVFARTMTRTRLYVGTIGTVALTALAWWYWAVVPLVFCLLLVGLCCAVWWLRFVERT